MCKVKTQRGHVVYVLDVDWSKGRLHAKNTHSSRRWTTAVSRYMATKYGVGFRQVVLDSSLV